MAEKPNPFAHLMSNLKKPTPAVAPTPKVAEKNISDSIKMGLTNPPGSDSSFSMEPEKKSEPKQMTPQAQLLMGAIPAAAPEPDHMTEADLMASVKIESSGSQELAAMDTTDMEPQAKVEKSLNVTAQAMTKRLVLDSSSSVRDLCDKVDELIKANTRDGKVQIVGPALGEIRNYVQSLMITLKARPEFDEVMLADDVRNVMQFIRATREEALATRTVKTEKKVVRGIKKEAADKKLKGFEAAFNNIMLGGFK